MSTADCVLAIVGIAVAALPVVRAVVEAVTMMAITLGDAVGAATVGRKRLAWLAGGRNLGRAVMIKPPSNPKIEPDTI